MKDLKLIIEALRHCGRSRAVNHGKSFHTHLIKHGSSHDLFMANNLISMYADLSLFDDAEKIFDEMPDRNVVTWTTLVSAYTNNKRPDKAINLYNQLLDSGSELPNGFMYSAVLKACGHVGDIGLGRLIHERIIRDSLESDVVLMNTLLDMHVKCGCLSEAKKVFEDIPHPNSTSWNTIISGYCKVGLMEDAVRLFGQMPEPNVVSWNSIVSGFADNGSPSALIYLGMMHRKGVQLDGFTLPCALKACTYLGSLGMGKQIHSYVFKSGFETSCFVVSALIDMYSNCNSINEAKKLFDLYSSYNTVYDNLALWNSMLSGFVVNEDNREALTLLRVIYSSGVLVDSYTFSSALKVCMNLLNLKLSLQMHGLIVINGYGLDYIVGSILIELYAKLGNINDVLQLFYMLPKKDVLSWSGLIMGCAKAGYNSLAFSLFRDMVDLDMNVDQYVISSVLNVCSSVVSLVSGKQVHGFSIKNGYESEAVIVTSLIDMYSKCGEIENGLSLFDDALERDVVCWTGIIVGCGQNGRAKEAIKIFHEMIQSEVKPNEVTYLGVLSACRHAGLLDEAWPIFNSMKNKDGLEPQLEHYYCMIDLFGQAGRFEEAEELIVRMPFKPDKTIWASLLAACGTHKNTNLVGVIAEVLLTNFSKDPSIYVMLSNAYATLEMWDHLSKVREAAKELGTKESGKSWVENLEN